MEGKAIRIVYVDYVLDPEKPGTTGLSDLVWDMAGRLARLGEDVHVVAPYTVDLVPEPKVKVHRFAIPPIGYRNIAGHLLIVLAAWRELRRIPDIDVIHTPEYVSAAALCHLMPSIPVVFTEPGNIYERIARGNPYDRVTTLVYKAAARVAAKGCARLIGTSEEMSMWWRRTGVPANRVYRLPLGIDSALFQRVRAAKKALGFDPAELCVLYAARLSRENGVDLALQAFARVYQEVPAARLHVLGSGPERERLLGMAQELGIAQAVTWHGWVDLAKLPAFYSAADAFLFCGRSGGTPRVMLQAMACGAPVVASAIGGIVDHIQDGETGLLFPSGDSQAAAEALLRLLRGKTLRRRLGSAGQAYVRSSVDWDPLVRRLRDEVYAVLAPKAATAGELAA